MEKTEILVDMAQWIALLGMFISPPVISLVKNVGGNWSKQLKNGVALFFAVIGALVAYAVTVDLGTVDVADFGGTWFPLIFGVAGMVAAQYTSYKTLWSGALAPAEAKLAALGAPQD